MTTKIGWRFPPTNGGRVDGFNDPGIAHFNGAPLSSLARETIQNSLDAGWRLEEPVHVTFELKDFTPDELGRNELMSAIEASKRAATDDALAEQALESARLVLERDMVPCLRVSDRNTTGLRGDQWRALVKMQGVSLKPEVEGAGGSHGIGKYAPFAVSALRTVFYWTCYEEDGRQVESFQGKSVLMSHESKEGETQGTGFFGIKDGCRELRGDDVPERFRLLSADLRDPVYGTSLSIAGFLETSDWRRRIASSVIENFFYAVHQGNLKVLIDPDQTLTDLGLLEIDDASLGRWFDYLEENAGDSEDSGDEGSSALKQARAFWQISDDGNLLVEKQDVDLGHCRLWIRVEEGLPSKVAFVRRTGMLVTTEQNGLIRFPGFQDFAALCVFEDPQGNELLRRMENPQHNRFEPDRLPEGERRRGRRALKRITDWIRSEVRKAAGPPEGGKSTVLSELAVYLPDLQPDEPLDDGGHEGDGVGEPGFAERVKITLKPVRRAQAPVLPPENEITEEGEGDGEDTGQNGGTGTGTNGGENGTGGPGDGEGEGGTGVRGGGQVRGKRIPISNVRILAVQGRENCYQVSFRANGNGVARLDLDEAGDSSAIPRDDVRPISENVSLDRFPLVNGERTQFEITADAPIGGRAWRLSATEAVGDQE
jgi:hypothetical protein